MKTNNKSLKTAAICGALAVLSLVNVCILSFNKSQVSPILTKNVNADAQQILGPYTLGFNLAEFYASLCGYYRFKERTTICTPVVISNGSITRQELKDSNINADVTGNATIDGTGYLDGGVNSSFNYSMKLQKKNTNYFDYSLDVSLPGKDWLVKTCESCSRYDEGVLSSRCVPYDECSQLIQTRINAYKAALKIK